MVLWKPYVTLHSCYIPAIDRFLWSGSGSWLGLSVKLARVTRTNASTPGLALAKVPVHSCARNCRLDCFGHRVTGVCPRYRGLLVHGQRPGLDCAELYKHRKEQCLFQTGCRRSVQKEWSSEITDGLWTSASLSVFWERKLFCTCLKAAHKHREGLWVCVVCEGTIRGFSLWQIHAFLEMVRMLLETGITRRPW